MVEIKHREVGIRVAVGRKVIRKRSGRDFIAWWPWGIASLGLALLVVAIVFNVLNMRGPNQIYRMRLAEIVFPAISVLTGAMILHRQPSNRIGWIFCAIGSLFTFEKVVTQYWVYSLFTNPGISMLETEMGWLRLKIWWIPIYLIAFLLMLFPTGRLPSKRWTWLAWLSSVPFVAFILPIITGSRAQQAMLSNLTVFAVVLVLFLSLFPLLVRFRGSTGVERQQLKWFVYASLFTVIGLVGINFFDIERNLITRLLGEILLAAVLNSIVVAVGIAILRYRLYDIDVIIRKTLVYTVVTGLLALVYFGGVLLLQELFASLGAEQSPAALVLSTLLIAALFNPLRKRVQEGVDRRFYRKKYDAEGVLAAFAAQARDEVDIERLSAALVGAVEETVQPEQVSLWLKEPGLRHSERQG